MAKASVTITCSKCGAKFVKEKKCYNRTEADNWEAYAGRTYDICPSCYGKQMQEEKKARGLLLSVRLRSPYKSEKECVALIYDGDTYSHKDSLREMGATWTDLYPAKEEQFAGGMFAFDSRQRYKKWVINCTPEDLGSLIKRSSDLGATIISGIDEMQLTTWAAVHNQVLANHAEKDAEKAKKLEALGPMPDWLEAIKEKWPTGAKWNTKFYGKPGRWTIYLDNEKITLSDELKVQMEQTLCERRKWREAVDKINV